MMRFVCSGLNSANSLNAAAMARSPAARSDR
jgi:hypothetical protein